MRGFVLGFTFETEAWNARGVSSLRLERGIRSSLEPRCATLKRIQAPPPIFFPFLSYLSRCFISVPRDFAFFPFVSRLRRLAVSPFVGASHPFSASGRGSLSYPFVIRPTAEGKTRGLDRSAKESTRSVSQKETRFVRN